MPCLKAGKSLPRVQCLESWQRWLQTEPMLFESIPVSCLLRRDAPCCPAASGFQHLLLHMLQLETPSFLDSSPTPGPAASSWLSLTWWQVRGSIGLCPKYLGRSRMPVLGWCWPKICLVKGKSICPLEPSLPKKLAGCPLGIFCWSLGFLSRRGPAQAPTSYERRKRFYKSLKESSWAHLLNAGILAPFAFSPLFRDLWGFSDVLLGFGGCN